MKPGVYHAPIILPVLSVPLLMSVFIPLISLCIVNCALQSID